MPKLLSVQASPRGGQSISKALSKRFELHWADANPGGTIVRRDLMADPVPYVDVDWIAGVYAPESVIRTPDMCSALMRSAELIEEVSSADRILIGTPMYNFSVPAVLKSWIDYIVRPGFTFALAPGWPALLGDRRTDVIVATREEYRQDDQESLDQVTPVLRTALRFIGIRDVHSILAGGSLGVNRGDVKLQDHLAKFEDAIAAVARVQPAVSR